MKDDNNGCVGCLMLVVCGATLIGVLLYMLFRLGGY